MWIELLTAVQHPHWAIIGAIGALLRLLYGGAPHVVDPATGQKDEAKSGLIPRPIVLVLMTALAWWAMIPIRWKDLDPVDSAGYLLVAIAVTAVWSPGWGSWMAPGTRDTPDDEFFAPAVRLIAERIFGWKELEARRKAEGEPLKLWSTVGYDVVGLTIRYGVMTVLVGAVAVATNLFLGTFVDGQTFAPVGFLIGLAGWAWQKAEWDESPFVWKPWLDPYYANSPLELTKGFMIYGWLAACRM